MAQDPLRILMISYGTALAVAAAAGLSGWAFVLAFWFGGPVVVGVAAILRARAERRVPLARQTGVDLASWDADLVQERSSAGSHRRVPCPDPAAEEDRRRVAGL